MQKKIWSEYLKGRDHLGHPSVDGSILLKWILRKYGVRVWIAFIWLRIGSSDG